MKRLFFKSLLALLFLISISLNAQTQIGSDIDGEAAGDLFGNSISLSSDGSIVAIGAVRNDGNGTESGHVRIYENNLGDWNQIGSDIDGEEAYDLSGYSVSLSSDGSIVAIGAVFNQGNVNGNYTGHVRIYENNLGDWIQIGSDIDGDIYSELGVSVSLSSDGSIVAIGASDSNNSAGFVRIYENNLGDWIQIGSDIYGEGFNDFSGDSISLSSDGSIVAIGALLNGGNGTDSGHVRVYENNLGDWIQIGSDIDGEAAGDASGYSVSLSSDGSIVAIGAVGNDENGSGSGHVRIYENNLGNWTQIGSDIDGEAAGDRSGYSVSLSSDGSIVAIGAIWNEGNGTESGHVRIYQNNLGDWIQIGSDIDGEAAGDLLGHSVNLSSDGSIVGIGASYNDGNGFDSGHVRVYDLSDILSVADEIVNRNFSVYPNPTSSKFQIALNSSLQLKSVRLLNSLGQEVLKSTKKVVDVSGFSTGVYYLKVETDKGIGIKKVVVK